MRRQRVLRVELNGHASLVSGHGSRELINEVTGRYPMWVSVERAWSLQEWSARKVVAEAYRRGFDVDIVGPRARRARLLETLNAAPMPAWPPRFPEQPDPGEGRW